MKKRVCILLYVGLLTMLTACQKAPEEVRKNIKTSADKATESDIDVKYDTLKNIYKTINQVKNNSYDNLSFKTDFTINMPESIGLLKLKQTEGFYKNNKDLIKSFVKEIDPNVKMETDVFPLGYQYRDFKGKESFSIGDNGFFYHQKYKYNNWIMVDNGEPGDFTLIKEVYLRKSHSDETFHWNKKIFTIKDIINKAANYGNELSATYNDMDWIPEKILIYQHKSGEYYFEILFTKSYQDVDLFYNEWGNHKNAMKEPYVQVYQPFMVIDSSQSVMLIDNCPGIIEFVETKKSYDKIITLKHATEALSNLLSSYRKYEVQWISLEYRLVYETDDGSDKMLRNTAYAGKIYETRPCWTFYLNDNLNNSAFATVDCVTGEIEFVSSN